MGIILSESNSQVYSLTERRAISALPIAGRYRLIDFVLSNMVNSGITNVGIVLKHKYSSLMDHLGSGREWNLSRKSGGLRVFPPYIRRGLPGVAEGNIDLLASTESFIRKSKQQYALLSTGNAVFNINFTDVMDFHTQNNAEITLVYYEHNQADNRILSNRVLLEVSEDNLVTRIEMRPGRPKSNNVFMNLILLERDFLHYLIDEAVSVGEHDFIRDILIKNLSNLKICAYKFDGYIGCVDSVRSYFEISMDMLDADIRNELFNPDRPIYTKIKDQVPTKYENNASVHNSLIADGCIIDGEVRNSILFRGVNIGKGSKVFNSIVMQDAVIQANCELQHCILDKEVVVRDAGRLIGESGHPMILGKGEIV
jgi:glucose-1-phosphate adenylyltransferase